MDVVIFLSLFDIKFGRKLAFLNHLIFANLIDTFKILINEQFQPNLLKKKYKYI